MLESFKRFLSSKGKVNEKYLPLYLKWITEGFRYLDIPLSQPITNEQKSQFLKKDIYRTDWVGEQIQPGGNPRK